MGYGIGYLFFVLKWVLLILLMERLCKLSRQYSIIILLDIILSSHRIVVVGAENERAMLQPRIYY